jgi:cation:H+ antiporter
VPGGVWVEFALAVGLIGVAGSALSRHGDAIALHTNLGEKRVGLFLLAIVTSLPELVIGVSAVTLADAADIAVGAILGSCVFNLVIIVLLDFLLRHETVYMRVSRDHVLAAGFGVILVGIVGFNVALGSNGHTLAVGHVGLYTPVLLMVYLIAARSLSTRGTHAEETVLAPASAGAPWLRFALAAVVVVATGIWLPFVGERLAVALGVHETFVGTLFLAFATSLPETVVTVAALRIGAFDMAVANLFGSNLVNVLILVPEDLLYREGPILAAVSPLHAVSGISAMVMTAIAIVGLLHRPVKPAWQGLSWVSLFLLVIYLLNSYAVYLYGG